MCPFRTITQSNIYWWEVNDLGRWNGEDYLPTHTHTGGDGPCPNGLYRSSEVYYYCGSTTTLVSISEPSMCSYRFDIEVDCSGRGMVRTKERTDFLPLISNSTEDSALRAT